MQRNTAVKEGKGMHTLIMAYFAKTGERGQGTVGVWEEEVHVLLDGWRNEDSIKQLSNRRDRWYSHFKA